MNSAAPIRHLKRIINSCRKKYSVAAPESFETAFDSRTLYRDGNCFFSAISPESDNRDPYLYRADPRKYFKKHPQALLAFNAIQKLFFRSRSSDAPFILEKYKDAVGLFLNTGDAAYAVVIQETFDQINQLRAASDEAELEVIADSLYSQARELDNTTFDYQKRHHAKRNEITSGGGYFCVDVNMKNSAQQLKDIEVNPNGTIIILTPDSDHK